MAAAVISRLNRPKASRRATHDPAWIRWLLTAATLFFLGLFLFVPLAAAGYATYMITNRLLRTTETVTASVVLVVE